MVDEDKSHNKKDEPETLSTCDIKKRKHRRTMSAAAARHRKQKLAKEEAATPTSGATDAVTRRLYSLLSSASAIDEATAYEALQLAQSQVRRLVDHEDAKAATELSYEVSLTLVEQHGRLSVANQLLTVLLQVLNESRTDCSEMWIDRIVGLDEAYRKALTGMKDEGEEQQQEVTRLAKLHLKFLKGLLKWSDLLGTVRFGDLKVQELVGMQSWRLATSAHRAVKKLANNDEDDDDDNTSALGLRSEAVTHLALAEKPLLIAKLLEELPAPTHEQLAMGHEGPPAQRDELLTRSILVFCAVENLRDANLLLRHYLEHIVSSSSASLKDLTKSYMSKIDGKAPSHAIFNCMLLRVCEKDIKTGPLYSWLLRSFGTELGKMYKPDVVKAYTVKIGRVYFEITPPPNMLTTLENMMSMMGSGGGGGGGGGFNPGMMQAMMSGMQGGGGT